MAPGKRHEVCTVGAHRTTSRFPAQELVLTLWMYVGGPGVWGAWMVWRLKLFTLQEFLACLWPVGALVLLTFWGAGWANLRCRRSTLVHGLLLLAFATGGTAAFLLLPRTLGLPGPWIDAGWLPRALWGALAGASLVGLLYPAVSLRLASIRLGYRGRGSRLLRFHRWGFAASLVGYAVVAGGTALLVPLDGGTVAAALVPPAMGAYLLGRTHVKP